MNQQLILASGSPRRSELLQNMNLTFDVIKSNIEEVIDPTLSPTEIVQSLAFQKAASVARNYRDAYVIGADTIVSLDNQILGKPKDEEEAIDMLTLLSGREHHVVTGVSIMNQEENITFYEKTVVEFWNLTSDEIWKYIRTGEPMDKAGAYGIQEFGAYLVKKINGDYFSVVGLPIAKVMRSLKKLGFS